jgi:hypothetical protein
MLCLHGRTSERSFDSRSLQRRQYNRFGREVLCPVAFGNRLEAQSVTRADTVSESYETPSSMSPRPMSISRHIVERARYQRRAPALQHRPPGPYDTDYGLRALWGLWVDRMNGVRSVTH